MSTWVIVHFQPIEKYPPVINFIRFVRQQPDFKRNLHVITIHPGEDRRLVEFSDVYIHRLSGLKHRGRLQRFFFYLFFNIKSLLILLKYKPSKILYYETLSAFGAWVYKKWINKNAEIFVHYHEYNSQQDYRTGMIINRWLHNSERKLYPVTQWVSHTNTDRMQFFLQDVKNAPPPNTFIMPNYPSSTWKQMADSVKKDIDGRIAFVYVGALSMQSMHTQSMAEFVAANSDKCYWDIYSDNHNSEVIDFLKDLNAPNIFFKGAVLYDELPLVLPRYDVGVILYTGGSLNYEYNAPNKFFEYHICGLNIWFGKGMKGMYNYISPSIKPWVRCIDFDELGLSVLDGAYRIEKIPEPKFVAENIYHSLWSRLGNS